VLLYELAIDLDVRSPELVDAAREMGMGELQAGAELDAQQVAALRARFGTSAPPPLVPPVDSAPAAGPAPGTGGRFRRKRGVTAAGAAPTQPGPAGIPAAGDRLGGPVTWGPPPAAPSPDPAPAAPPGPTAPATGSGAPSAGSFGGPVTWEPPATAAQAAAPPPPPPAPPTPLAAPPGPPAPMAVDPPAPAPAPSGHPVAPEHWGPPPPPPGAIAGGSAGTSGFSRGQIAAVAGVALLAVALFAFMAVNTGGDGAAPSEAVDTEAPERDAGNGFAQVEMPPLDGPEGGDPVEVDPATDTDTDTDTDTAPTAPGSAAAAEPRNVDEYCTGVRQVSAFLLELGEAAQTGSTVTYEDIRATVAAHRSSVAEGTALMVAHGPPERDADALTVRDGLAELLASVSESDTEEEFEAASSDEQDTAVADALDRMLPTWEARCA
jgi:hypothetical protein